MSHLLAPKSARADRAFERMYRKHVHDVYRYALVVLPSPEDAEDVTQTTFLNAYRLYQGGHRPRRGPNWLLALAHDLCRRRLRETAERPELVELEEDPAVVAIPDEQGPSNQDISRALGRLAFDQRATLVMREIEGRSYQEIAGILDISVNDVESLVFRARRALREELTGTITCHEAERAISRHLDGQLRRSERAGLRKHIRECPDCDAFARQQEAQRTALRQFAAVPLPSSLATFFGPAGVGRKFLNAAGSF